MATRHPQPVQPTRKPKRRRDKMLTMWLTAEELEQIKLDAQARDVSVSEYLRHLALTPG